MQRTIGMLIFVLIVAAASSLAQAQDGASLKDSPDTAEPSNQMTPRLELSSGPEEAAYETELRYRMIVQLIGFLVGLGVLHVIQVKLKINRGYFWFVVGGVILLFALNSFRPKNDPNQPRPHSDDPPTYAPTHAR